MGINDSYFLTPAHLEIARARYFRKNEQGLLVENDMEGVFWREVGYVFQNDLDDPHHISEAIRLRLEKKVIPAGRPLAQAGTEVKNMFNCFVLPIGDTREEISRLKTRHFHIQAFGGGTGINFSRLRPRGAVCKKTQGHASGAIGFITDVSYQSANIAQGGNRSGANLGVLECWHPDILDFITYKSHHNWENIRRFAEVFDEDAFSYFQWNVNYPWQTFNVSVWLDDEFVGRLKRDDPSPYTFEWAGEAWHVWEFLNPTGPRSRDKYPVNIVVTAPNEEIAKYKASTNVPYFNAAGMELLRGPFDYSAPEIFDMLARNAWEDGCPGVIFGDLARSHHNGEYFAPLSACNPCQPASACLCTPRGIRRLGQLDVGDLVWSGSEWTSIAAKWCTGKKMVRRYVTRGGVFLGTDDHKVVSNGTKMEACQAESIDISVVNLANFGDISSQDVVDGLVFGDGTVHKASGNLICLIIGRDDQSYHGSSVAKHLIRPRKVGPGYWEVETTLVAEELPLTYDRRVPERFLTGSSDKVRGFLRGLYSANGCVIDRGRVVLKASSIHVIESVQQMLSSVGIRSYYTVNKSGVVCHKNGDYLSRQSYDLNVTTDRRRFAELIGFLQPYKTEKLISICEGSPATKPKVTYDVVAVEDVGEEEVFDISVESHDHTYWTGGLLVSNCAEQFLPDNSVCCLTSLCLPSFFIAGKFDWVEFRRAIISAVRSLDNMIELNEVGDADIDRMTKLERRIGLGTTAVAELLILEGLRYDSEAARRYVEDLMVFLRDEAYDASVELAIERGAFPAFEFEGYSKSLFFKKLPERLREKIRSHGIRNVTVLTQAPVGTTGTTAGYSQGCEPYFAMAFQRNSRVGTFLDGSPAFRRWLEENDIEYELYGYSLPKLRENYHVPDHFVEAHEIHWRDHLKMQAVFAEYVDSGVTKTINLPKTSTVDDVKSAFMEAYDMGIKSTTVYRDGSKEQILERLDGEAREKKPTAIVRTHAPQRPRSLPCEVHHVTVKGERWTVAVGIYNGRPYELFAGPSSELSIPDKCKAGFILKEKKGQYSFAGPGGVDVRDISRRLFSDEHKSITRLISTSLRHGVPSDFIVDQLKKAEGSLVDFSTAVARVLKKYYDSKVDKYVYICEGCGSTNVNFSSGCPSCTDCGWSKCG